MAISLSDYPPLDSPASCPHCGGKNLRVPFHGRRTLLWFSECRDCHANIRSREYFTVAERRAVPVARGTSNPALDMAPLRAARDAALTKLNQRDGKLLRSREPGEEG